ncbi:Zinc finger and BTB domain-containing protein 14, partial [Araneus ventricosus]
QSEWKIDTPVWDESPSTSSGYRGPASPEMRSQHFVCPTCSKSFAWKNSLAKHMKIHAGEKLFTCEICQKSFGRNDDLKKHMKTHSKENNFKCNICDRSFQRKHCFAMHMQKHQEKKYDCRKCDRSFISLQHLNQHVRASHPEIKLTSVKRGTASTPEGNSKRVRREGGALNTFTSTFFQPTENSKKDFLLFFDEITPQLKEKIEEEIREKGAIKWYGVVKALFKRESEDGGEERVTPYFRSNVQIELVGDTVGDHVLASFTKILEAVDEFIRRGSAWILDKIVHFELCVAKYQPLRANSYIILPKNLVDKKAVLNIQNEDQKCLVWCLIAHKLNILAHDSYRVSQYTFHEQEIKLDGVECPVPLNKIPIVERLNNLRINVFGFEENEVFPLYVSKRVDEE